MSSKGKTAFEILHLAASNGFLVYAHGGDNRDWPGMQDAINKGWFEFVRDMPLPPELQGDDPPAKWRTEYKLTKKGERVRSTGQ